MHFGLLFSVLFASLLPASPVAAISIFGGCGAGSAGGVPGICSDAKGAETNKVNPIVSIIASAIRILALVVGVAATIGIILSGIRLMTASGDANGVAAARNALVYSLVGVAVAVLAQVIVTIIIGAIS